MAGHSIHPFAGSAYSTSKAALSALTREMAVEFAELGVRVNAVARGYNNNFMGGVEAASASPYRQRAMARTPMGRRGEIAEFGGAYLYLASDASRYATGAVVYVDGGYGAA